MKKQLYLITVHEDVEPTISGPFEDAAERDRFAKELRGKYEFDGGIFPLGIDGARIGKVDAWAYAGRFFEDDEIEAVGSITPVEAFNL